MNIDIDKNTAVIVLKDLEKGMSIELMQLDGDDANESVTQATLVGGAIVILMHEENQEFNRMIRNKIDEVFFPKNRILQ
jgi:hypothetical protein